MVNNNNPFSIKGKTILITGASSGIGRSIAINCALLGANLIITGRNGIRLNDTYESLSGNGHIQLQCDLTKAEDIQTLVNQILMLDGIVHCAGISKRLPLKFIKEDKLKEIFEINFFSSAMLTQKIVSSKKIRDSSSIVFISSVASNYATIGSIMYMSTKGAINSFMKGLANELSKSGIRVNAIQPGMIKTKMSNAISDDEIDLDLANYPLGRYGKPEEIAWAAIYLLSDATQWMTGSIITIDGGLTLR